MYMKYFKQSVRLDDVGNPIGVFCLNYTAHYTIIPLYHYTPLLYEQPHPGCVSALLIHMIIASVYI